MIGTKAVNSLVFAEYLNRVLWNATRGDDAPTEVIPDWVINATAVAVVCFVVMLVVGTRSLGPRAAVILTCMKVRVTVWRTERISSLLTKFCFVKVLALVCQVALIRFLAFLLKRHPPRKLSVILLGLLHRFFGRRAANPYPDPAIKSPPTAASYAQALYAGLWSFDGFNQANYVAGEMRNPARDIPRAIHSSMALVAVRLRLHLPSS